MAQMTTKRLISEDQDPVSDSGFGSVPPDCVLKCEPKGQLISKCPFGVFKSTNNQRHLCKDFCPSLLEEVKSKK